LGLSLDESRKVALEGNSLVGSIMVRNGAVIGVDQNRVTRKNDSTAHAEVDAIRDTCHRLGTTDLSDAIVKPRQSRVRCVA
jgi:guanine deaminase